MLCKTFDLRTGREKYMRRYACICIPIVPRAYTIDFFFNNFMLNENLCSYIVEA